MPHTTYRRRVLIADADPERAGTLRALLHVWGHSVACAADVTSALRRAEAFRPDIVIVGPALHSIGRRLRQTPAMDGVLLVAVTDNNAVAAVFAWFDTRLSAPFDPERLRAFVVTGTAHSFGA